MSQIFVPPSDASIPVDVPTSFVTDSGTAVPAAHILNITGSFVTANNLDGIQTEANPAGNTVAIELTNRIQSSVTAIAGTTTDLVTFDLGIIVAAYRFSFEVIGIDPITSNAIGFSMFSTFKTSGVAATVVQTPYVDADEDIGALLTMVAGTGIFSTMAILKLTLPAGNNMNVNVVGTYVKIQ